MYNVQLAVKTQLIYCTICTMYTQLHVRPILGHPQVVSYSLERQIISYRWWDLIIYV